MCLCDLYTYPPSERAHVAQLDGNTLAGAPRPSVVAALDSDAPAIPIIRTRDGIPRVPTNDERLGVWALKYFGHGHHHHHTAPSGYLARNTQ